MKEIAQFLGTALGVITLGVLFVAANYFLISVWAGVIALFFVLAIAIVDIAAGLKRRTYSAEIGLAWDRHKLRFWAWLVVMLIVLLALLVHFAEVVRG